MTDDEDPDIDGEEPRQPNASDEKAVRRQRTSVALRHRESEQFWQAVFSTEVGRREMWGILQSAHAFEERFVHTPAGFPCPEATWFQAGQQALGLRLYQSWLLLAREGVILMQDEHDSRFQRPKIPQRKRESDNG